MQSQYFLMLAKHFLSRVTETSNNGDFEAAAKVCLPVINKIITELSNGTYPKGSFLNVEIPTDSANHKVTLEK